ncbi:Cytochrome P450 4C1-like protein [Leptotrombidium deliense]|uniref:Cytochrome P450 4C1-like protein n=1 Tax=Leptotrombidium deliense TaxID=299467 RepID=A0A443RZN2_9ACAR|nr:Cytochrome P450 4C1-like protein [Leptotrombidium deliense]
MTEMTPIFELLSFLVAGYETSAFTIIAALFLLGVNEEVQNRAREEIKLIFEENKNEDLNREDTNKMHYLECVINETMRMYPPIPFFGFKAESDVNIDGYTISKGENIIFPLTVIHENNDYFSNPRKFNPERFVNRNLSEFDGAFMPFGKGRRLCIGNRFSMLEMKIMLANMLHKYSWRYEGDVDDFKVKILIGATIDCAVNLTFSKLNK